MKNNGKNDKDCCSTNHHANPSHMNPEIEAMLAKDQLHPHKETSKPHAPERDQRAQVREMHTNGSMRKGDL